MASAKDLQLNAFQAKFEHIYPMKVEESISDRKLELAHWLIELDDEAVIQEMEELKKVRR